MYYPRKIIKEYFDKDKEFRFSDEELNKIIEVFFIFFDEILPNKYDFTSEETQEKRKSICVKCPDYVSESSSCNLCGCIIPNKIKKPPERCPVDRWTVDYDFVRDTLKESVEYIHKHLEESGDNVTTIEEHQEIMTRDL